MGAKINHISYYLPSKVVTNEDLSLEFPEYTPEQIYKKTGVRIRTHTNPTQIGSDMAFQAFQNLLDETNLKKEEVDFLIYITEGQDYKAPATAIILQDRMGLSKDIMAIDVPLGCSGFTHSIGLAKMAISSGQAKNVLLLYGDTPSFVSHPKNFALRSLFSDAGAAVWVSNSNRDYIGDFVYGSDGSGAKNLFVDNSSTRNPASIDYLSKKSDVGGMPYGEMKMDGLEIFTFSLQSVPKLVHEILRKNNLELDDVDLFIFHQASNIILKSIQRKLRLPDSKMAYYIENFGNTVSVSIPIAICESIKDGRIKNGSKVLVAGFGIGYSWSGTILYY